MCYRSIVFHSQSMQVESFANGRCCFPDFLRQQYFLDSIFRLSALRVFHLLLILYSWLPTAVEFKTGPIRYVCVPNLF